MAQNYYEERTFENLRLEDTALEHSQFVDCRFINCNFTGLKLMKCEFFSCQFEDCQIANIKNQYCQMQFSDFIRCTLTGVDWATLLPMGKLAAAISILQSCRLKYNTFTEMNFTKFNFENTEIIQSIFAKCQLAESSFKGCKLTDTEFYQCDIRKADFTNATGYRMDIASNKMKGARFSYPDVMALLDVLEIKID